MASKKRIGANARAKKPQARISPDMLPRSPIFEASQIAHLIHNTYAGKSASGDDIAKAFQLSPQSTFFKNLLSSAQAYGLVNKEGGDLYSLSELGRKIVAPTYEGESDEGVRKAILTPTLLSKFYSDYDGHPIPSENYFPNVLESRYGIPRNKIKDAQAVIYANAEYAGILERSPVAEEPIVRLSSSRATKEKGLLEESAVISKTSETKKSETNESIDWAKLCFYITPIGEEGSEVRKHADMMLKHLLEPIITQQFNLSVIRADKIEKSGLINQQVLEHLAKAKLCVADLSFGNPNAFYELGVRHVFKLPTIQIIRRGDRIPFDVSQGRTITIDTSDIYTIMDRFESARRELAEHVKYILSASYQDGTQDNPVNIYLPGVKVVLPK